MSSPSSLLKLPHTTPGLPFLIFFPFPFSLRKDFFVSDTESPVHQQREGSISCHEASHARQEIGFPKDHREVYILQIKVLLKTPLLKPYHRPVSVEVAVE